MISSANVILLLNMLLEIHTYNKFDHLLVTLYLNARLTIISI